MPADRFTLAGAFTALVGAVLLVLEVGRTLASNALGGAGTVLLWVGLGLSIAGAALLTLAASRASSGAGTTVEVAGSDG